MSIHIKNRVLPVKEIVAVDYTRGIFHNTHHSHSEAYELIFCLSGHLLVQIDEHWTDMEAGSCMIVPAGSMHDSVADSADTKTFYIAFLPEKDIFSVVGRHICLPEKVLIAFDYLTDEMILGYINTGHMENVFTLIPHDGTPVGADQLILCTLEMLLVYMLRAENASEPESSPVPEKIGLSSGRNDYLSAQVMQYIKEHVTEKLSVKDIAEYFGYSRSRLSTLYKEAAGIGLNEAIIHEKINRAKQLLLESDMQINEISEYLGFSSPQYFTNRFYLKTGMSPSNYSRFKRTRIDPY